MDYILLIKNSCKYLNDVNDAPFGKPILQTVFELDENISSSRFKF